MASAAISGVIMRSQPGQRAAFHSPAVRGAGVVAAVAKNVVGADIAVRVGSAVRPQIRLCPLAEPKPGRRQAVKAEAAKRGRDSVSLCVGHVRQLGGESPLCNLMEVKH